MVPLSFSFPLFLPLLTPPPSSFPPFQPPSQSPAEIADISLPLNYSTNGGDLSIFLSPPSTTDLSAPPTLSCPSSSPPSPLLSLLQQCSLDNPSIYKRLKKGEVEPDHLLNGLISDKELADLDIRLGARKALLALSSQNQQVQYMCLYLHERMRGKLYISNLTLICFFPSLLGFFSH